VEVRHARPDEYEAIGELTVAAYWAVTPDTDAAVRDLTSYEPELRAVAERAAHADVLVAADGDGEVLGAVTFVPDPASALAEFDEPDTASIRMLAVAPGAQRRGVGEALARACVERAAAAGRAAVLLHSTEWMTIAHRLYQRMGFVRAEGLDWQVAPDFRLLAFRLDLR
jgi:ribosomal protein S18 acetylase RimI-like enzyme